MTPAEVALWALLRDRRLAGMKFRRQHAVGPFIADFYCHRARLVVEVDGGIHRDAVQRGRDEVRDAWMNACGITVVRFTNDEALGQPDAVLARLEAILEALAARGAG